MIIHQFLLAQKALDIFERYDSDCKDVDLNNTRKRYAVIDRNCDVLPLSLEDLLN